MNEECLQWSNWRKQQLDDGPDMVSQTFHLTMERREITSPMKASILENLCVCD